MTPSKLTICLVFAVFGWGCATAPEQGLKREPVDLSQDADGAQSDENANNEGEGTPMNGQDETQEGFGREYAEMAPSDDLMCDGDLISYDSLERILVLTDVGENETIYSTYDRIDEIAALFEACSDPWGMFPTTYRRITARGLAAIENGEFDDEDWARRIIVDFAGRYMANLRLALLNENPSWAWAHYYKLADREDVSRTRAVLVAMVAHLTLDLPHSLVAIETTEDNKDDFFVFGEMMIEVSDLLIEDLRVEYDADTEDILTGFFVGNWVDGAFGEDTMITLSYQAIRSKSWNNRWLLQQSWGSWVAASEIYTGFWAIDGVLATLDALGTI